MNQKRLKNLVQIQAVGDLITELAEQELDRQIPCNYCREGHISAMVHYQKDVDDIYDVEIEVYYCPACGRKL